MTSFRAEHKSKERWLLWGGVGGTFLLLLGLSIVVILNNTNKVQDRIEELKKEARPWKPVKFCRHKESVQVHVIDNQAIFPCRNTHDLSYTENIKLYKHIPNKGYLELIPANDSRIIDFRGDFGFHYNLTSDLTAVEDISDLSYSCELAHEKATPGTFVNIGLSYNDTFVEVEPACRSSLLHYHEEVNNTDFTFYCNTRIDALKNISFTWFTSKYGGWQDQIDARKRTTSWGLILRSKITIRVHDMNLIGLTCQVSENNSGNTLIGFLPINVDKSVKPKILYKDEGTDLIDEEGLQLQCIYEAINGIPAIWYKDGILAMFVNKTSESNVLNLEKDLTIAYSTLKDLESPRNTINYTCVVSTSTGSDSKTFIIRTRSWTVVIIMAIMPIIPLLISLALVYRYWTSFQMWKQYYRKLPPQANKPKIDIETAEKITGGAHGDIYAVKDTTDPENIKDFVAKTFQWHMKYNKKHIKIVFEDLIAEITINAMLFDPKNMDGNDCVKNIVKYVGWTATSLNERNVYLVMDKCDHGSLLDYLRKCSTDPRAETGPLFYNDIEYGACMHSNRQEIQQHRQLQGRRILALSHLMKYAEQLADAFAYISSLEIVHRDIALRNILLKEFESFVTSPGDNFHDCVVPQVSDFGMSRVVNKSEGAYMLQERNSKKFSNEREQLHKNVPVRWYPVEAHFRDEYRYTTKSDVWSFGVMLWEMFELGRNEPYPEVLDSNVINYIRSGNRLQMPALLDRVPEMYDLMMSCWETEPEKRPSFREIHQRLQEINHEYGVYGVVNEVNHENLDSVSDIVLELNHTQERNAHYELEENSPEGDDEEIFSGQLEESDNENRETLGHIVLAPLQIAVRNYPSLTQIRQAGNQNTEASSSNDILSEAAL